MFLESVINGLAILTYWQIYLAGLIYSFVILLPLFLIGLGMSKFEALGCITILIDPFLRALATLIFIFTLFPIILGLANAAAWSFPWVILINDPWFMIKSAIILMVLSFLLAFIPIIGQFQSVHTLLLGSVCLISVIKTLHSIEPNFDISRLHFFPGYIYVIGFLIISAISSYLAILLSAFLLASSKFLEDFSEIIIIPIGAAFGFIPVFIYGAWIGIQIKNFY